MINLKRCILIGRLQNDTLQREQKRAHYTDQEYQVEFLLIILLVCQEGDLVISSTNLEHISVSARFNLRLHESISDLLGIKVDCQV